MYERCLFTVYPSLYEGWGLPIAESLKNGKFVLASSSSSIPEVGGSYVEYLDPWDAAEWASRILFYATNREELGSRESDIAKGFAPFAWQDTVATVWSEVDLLLTSA